MMPATRTRPSTMGRDRFSVPRAPEIEDDARDDHRDQHERDRAQEELVAEDGERLEQRILGDLAEDDADHERRTRPVMALQQVAEPAHEEDENEVLPRVLADIATEDREDE